VHQSHCRASGGEAHDKEWSVCRVPPQAHGKSPVAAGILGQFAVCLPYDARQIDPIVLFFLFFTSKNS
jgi:hypothetical protein